MRSTLLRSAWLAVAVLALGGCPKRPSMLNPFPSAWVDEPAPPSVNYLPLKMPRASLTLPALFVGAQQQPSSACFAAVASSTPTPVLSSVDVIAAQDRSFQDSLSVRLRQSLVTAGLSAQAAGLLAQRVHTHYKNMKGTEVDPANIRANFKNQACTSSDLEWLTDRRQVAIGAYVVDSLFVELGSLADASQRAAIQAAIQRIGTDLSLSLAARSTATDSLTYYGTNVFIGVSTAGLRALRCPAEMDVALDPGQDASFTGCNNRVSIYLSRSKDTPRYSLRVSVPDEGLDSGTLDLDAGGTSFRVPIDSLRYVFGELAPRGGRVHLRLSVFEVALSGAGPS